MSVRFPCLILMLFFCYASAAEDLAFSSKNRVAYLRQTAKALRQISKPTLDRIKSSLSDAQKNECRSLHDLTVLKCLQTTAQRLCAQVPGNDRHHCTPVADLILANSLNEDLFITKDERRRIYESSSQYSEGYAKALGFKYALLASQLLLTSKQLCVVIDGECLPTEIERYCTTNSDSKGLPWQACAGAIVWFVAER
jgi:hypothetical protein